MDCTCPSTGILTQIPSANCPFDLKQIQRIAFGTRGIVLWDSATGNGAADGTPLPMKDAQLDTKADWTIATTATDNSLLVITPLIGGEPKIEAGEAITEGGGDNTTLNGVELTVGTNPSKFSTKFNSLSPEQEKAIKAISCEEVEVYFFTQDGSIIASKPDAAKENVRGFIADSFYFSDRNNEGFGTKDFFTMSFSLRAGWSEKLVKVKAIDFNPLYDI